MLEPKCCLYTYLKKRGRGERRLHDRNELWVPFGIQISLVALPMLENGYTNCKAWFSLATQA